MDNMEIYYNTLKLLDVYNNRKRGIFLNRLFMQLLICIDIQ